MPHREYRSLERQCRAQAALTAHEKARRELEKMELEYRTIADWLEARLADGELAHNKPRDNG